ncbi:MAG: T9SS type A sorting domain-containing protein [Pedobacter sp.]|nr:MAG: T9SS type A sorting domain-containing protein [Pedobacter sp.]
MSISTLRFLSKIFVFLLVSWGVKASAQTITVNTITPNPVCAGTNVAVAYSYSGPQMYYNFFTVLLSDASGNFSPGTTLSTFRSETSGTATVSIPANVGTGSYKIKITSSEKQDANSQLSSSFTVSGIPTIAVTSPINICQTASPVSLANSITVPAGATAYWLSNNRITLTTYEAYDTGASNRQANDGNYTYFTTSTPNLTLFSVDYQINANQVANSLVLGIFDSAGNLLSTSSTTTTSSGSTVRTITNVFGYRIKVAGTYSIRVISGQGQLAKQSNTAQSSLSGLSLAAAGTRFENNFVFSTEVPSTIAPFPPTSEIGTTRYYVYGISSSGCEGITTSFIDVTVNAAPEITSPSGSNVCLNLTTAMTVNATGGTWVSSNPSVASVNSSGVVTGLALGSSVISYTLATAGCTPSLLVNVYKAPTNTYAMTGTGGSSCSPSGTSYVFGLNGSESGMSYQLTRGSNPVGSLVAGTGSAISFPAQTLGGDYTVYAVNPSSSACPKLMTGTKTITATNLAQPTGGSEHVYQANQFTFYSKESATSAVSITADNEIKFGFQNGNQANEQYLVETGKPIYVNANQSYLVTFDFNNTGLSGTELVNGLSVSFTNVTTTNNTPANIATPIASNSLGVNSYVSQSFVVKPSSTSGNAYLEIIFNFTGRPQLATTMYIKNIKITPIVCAGSNLVLGVVPAAGASASTTYAWYANAAGGTALQNSTSTTFTTPALSASTSYYAAANVTGGCESLRTQFDVTVSPTLNFGAQTTAICSGGTFNFIPDAAVDGTLFTWTSPKLGGANTAISAQTTPVSSISGTLPATSGTYTYTVTPIFGNCSGTAFTLTVNITSTQKIWTGAGNNTVWSNTANWSCNSLPTSGSDVVIQDVTSKPILDQDVVLGNVTFQGKATLSINGRSLTINGVISGSTGLIGSGSSQLIMGGTVASTLGFNQTVANGNLLGYYTQSKNAKVTLLNMLNVKTAVSLTGTSSILDATANAYLTLRATSAAENANIAALTGTAEIQGKVNIQYWFTGGAKKYRSTRMISSSINDAADANTFFIQLKNYMFITGPGNTSNGFDLGGGSQPNAVTLTTYVEPNLATVSQFSPLANILSATKSVKGKGYFLFYRGDRSHNISYKLSALNSSFAVPETQLVTITGKVNAANITGISFPVTNSNNPNDNYNGYNVLGNPFPSTISLKKLYADNPILGNISCTIINADGSYATVAAPVVAGGEPIVAPSTLNAQYIQPGQGFYVKATNSGSVIFNESIKVIDIYNPARLLDVGGTPAIELVSNGKVTSSVSATASSQNPTIAAKTDILRLNISDSENTNEGVLVFADGYSAGYEQRDAAFFGGNNTVSLSSLSSDDVSLAINFLPKIDEIKSVKLFVNSAESTALKMNFTDLSAISSKIMYLRDNYLHARVRITEANASYSFNIDKSIAASFGTERFVLDFEELPSPSKLISFEAVKNPATVLLKWRPAVATDNRFELERSKDQVNFSVIRSMDGNGSASYTHLDEAPILGHNFYRLKETTPGGAYLYSEVLDINFVEIANSSTVKKVILYPNPTSTDIRIDVSNDTRIQLSIFDMKGKQVISSIFEPNQAIKQNVSKLMNGFYFAEMKDLKTSQVIGVSKFYKL